MTETLEYIGATHYIETKLSVALFGALAIFLFYRGLGASRLAFARLLRPHGSSAFALLPPASILSPIRAQNSAGVRQPSFTTSSFVLRHSYFKMPSTSPRHLHFVPLLSWRQLHNIITNSVSHPKAVKQRGGSGTFWPGVPHFGCKFAEIPQ